MSGRTPLRGTGPLFAAGPGAESRRNPEPESRVFHFRHRVACLGDCHARRLAEAGGRRPHSVASGRLRIGTQASSEGAKGGLGADAEADLKWLYRAAVQTMAGDTGLAAAVISFGGNMILRRGSDGRQITVTSAPAACDQSVAGVRSVLEVLSLDPLMYPILLSVVPRLHLLRGS